MCILARGIDRIRGAASRGNARHCEIESDHLHNIPSYIVSGDTANHLYYLAKEVPFYLQQANMKDEGNWLLLDFYIPWWQELEVLIPIDGSPWSEEWRAMKSAGWNYGRKSS